MIYLFTALYSEAKIFIERFHLKKAADNPHFQQFGNESAQLLLTISGAGEIAAAAAVSAVCTEYPPDRKDVLVNAGSCAGPADRDGVYVIQKLTEQTTGKTFYPDLLYRHMFQEAELCTVMKPWKHTVQTDGRDSSQVRTGAAGAAFGEMKKQTGTVLYDMEAAAIYQAGAYFFGPHQMVFLKVISDSGEENRLAAEEVSRRMDMYGKSICTFVEQLSRITREAGRMAGPEGRSGIEPLILRLSADLHCSRAMEDSLRQYIRYAMLAEVDYERLIQQLYEEKKLPCRDKREGKRCFEVLKQRLL